MVYGKCLDLYVFFQDTCYKDLYTWLKLSKALCKLANIPVGGSLVILIAASRIPCGMMWLSALDAGSALINTRYAALLSTLNSSIFFSSLGSHLATRWTFFKTDDRKINAFTSLTEFQF